jgi:SRSO17 transposase
LLGGDDAVLILDESGFAKKGEASAGVARQWNGRLGKVDNSQVGVFTALCRGEMSCLIDGHLYLPQFWVSDPERCKQAAIPKAEQLNRAKSELALEMVDEADRCGVRYGDIAVDGGYGKEPAFLRGLDRRGKRFVADVHKDQRVYLEDPQLRLPEWTGRGRRPTRPVTTGVPVRVDVWAAAQLASSWRRLVLREGEKGLIAAEYLHARVWLWNGEEAMAHCWHLMVRREVGAKAVSHYCLSNAPETAKLKALARVQAQRFFIEHCFREAKSKCGMAGLSGAALGCLAPPHGPGHAGGAVSGQAEAGPSRNLAHALAQRSGHRHRPYAAEVADVRGHPLPKSSGATRREGHPHQKTIAVTSPAFDRRWAGGKSDKVELTHG